MRLTRKFILALAIGILLVLGVSAWVRVRREIALFDDDMQMDAALMGRLLAKPVTRIWHDAGEKEARAMVQQASNSGSHMHVRWVWLDARHGERDAPYAPAPQLLTLSEDDAFSTRVGRGGVGGKDGMLITYVRIPTPDLPGASPRPAALELAESLSAQRQYVRATIRSTVLATSTLVGVCSFAALVLGVLFVGRPTRLLVKKARRVGAGDLGEPLVLEQKDELGELAREMNAMCDNLADARERARVEAAARMTAVEQLRHADRLMTVGKLASGIAHELGTPLNVVGGRAQMIADGDVEPAELGDNARIIVEQTKRMTKIIRQLLDFARRGEARKVRVQMRSVVASTLALLQPMAHKRGVLVIEPGGELAGEVLADEGQLQQVLTNLVVNAIQACNSGGQVTVTLARESATPPSDHGGPAASYLRLTVADTGCGMSADTVARIFEPFFTTKGVGEGTGLGLSVTYGIVREHGGWVDVHSQPGAGSRFDVYLPEAAAA